MCLECASELVHPVTWDEAGPDNWHVLLRCPDCETYREGVFTQATVDAFDEELDRAGDALPATTAAAPRQHGRGDRPLRRRAHGGRDPSRRLLSPDGPLRRAV